MSDRPTRQEAAEQGVALFAAHGRATRLAIDATADWYDPARAQVIRSLLLYAYCTRQRRDLLPHYREQALRDLRSYRALKAQGRV